MTEPLIVEPRLLDTITPDAMTTDIASLDVGWTVPRILSVCGELFFLTGKFYDADGSPTSWVYRTQDCRRRLTVYHD